MRVSVTVMSACRLETLGSSSSTLLLPWSRPIMFSPAMRLNWAPVCAPSSTSRYPATSIMRSPLAWGANSRTGCTSQPDCKPLVPNGEHGSRMIGGLEGEGQTRSVTGKSRSRAIDSSSGSPVMPARMRSRAASLTVVVTSLTKDTSCVPPPDRAIETFSFIYVASQSS